MLRFILFAVSLLCVVNSQYGQKPVLEVKHTETRITIEGRVYPAIITETGDTLILADLDNISVTALRKFANDEEYRKYLRFRNYALKVYPYAKEAIRIYRELEYASAHLSKREKKKKLKELEKQLTDEFEEPLKNLTKLQGKIMIKMIEKEINRPVYYLIKEIKGGFNAFYWHQFSKLYSYDLKEGYNKGDYPVLDAVLQDFDISYRIENETNLKYIKINRSETDSNK